MWAILPHKTQGCRQVVKKVAYGRPHAGQPPWPVLCLRITHAGLSIGCHHEHQIQKRAKCPCSDQYTQIASPGLAWATVGTVGFTWVKIKMYTSIRWTNEVINIVPVGRAEATLDIPGLLSGQVSFWQFGHPFNIHLKGSLITQWFFVHGTLTVLTNHTYT